MEIIVQSKTERISPRKLMLVADVIRNKKVEQALITLSLGRKRAASVLIKLLESGVANAVNRANQNKDLLFVKKIEVLPGPFLKRFRASTRGRTHPYKKRSSHIKIVLGEKGK